MPLTIYCFDPTKSEDGLSPEALLGQVRRVFQDISDDVQASKLKKEEIFYTEVMGNFGRPVVMATITEDRAIGKVESAIRNGYVFESNDSGYRREEVRLPAIAKIERGNGHYTIFKIWRGNFVETPETDVNNYMKSILS